jgi:hypothetical protein
VLPIFTKRKFWQKQCIKSVSEKISMLSYLGPNEGMCEENLVS